MECNGTIDFIHAEKTLTDFTNLFSPDNLKKMMSETDLKYDLDFYCALLIFLVNVLWLLL